MIGLEGCDGMASCQADYHHPECVAECSACGHQQREHKNRIHACEVDVLGIVGWRRCTCTFVRKSSHESVEISRLRGALLNSSGTTN